MLAGTSALTCVDLPVTTQEVDELVEGRAKAAIHGGKSNENACIVKNMQFEKGSCLYMSNRCPSLLAYTYCSHD